MEKKKITEHIITQLGPLITIDAINEQYKQSLNLLYEKYEDVTNIEIDFEKEDDYYYQKMIISYTRLETDEEVQQRLHQKQQQKIFLEQQLIKTIEDHKDFVIQYLKEQKLI